MNIPVERILTTKEPFGWSGHPEGTEYFKVPCGETFPVEYWTKETLKQKHMDGCRVCAVVSGYSKRLKGFNQDEVALLFLHNKEAYSSSENYNSIPKMLRNGKQTFRTYHYGTINAIKTHEGKIIVNTQDHGGGFAYVTNPKGVDYRMPLSTLRNVLDFELEEINVLERDEDGKILFTAPKVLRRWYPDKSKGIDFKGHTEGTGYYMIGREDGQEFIIELFDEPTTIKDALNSLKPKEILGAELAGKRILRQGDLFFVETDEIPTEEVFKSQYRDHISKNWNTGEMETNGRYLDIPSLVLPEIKDDGHGHRTYGPTVSETNHRTTRLSYSDVKTFVKGTIRHDQHGMLKLGMDTWWLVYQNRRKAVHTVGGGGRD